MDLPTPTPITKPKLTGYDFFRSIGSPRHVLAPMVDASELPWRILSRAPIDGMPLDSSEKGKGRIKQEAATLAYTPMIHARLFSGDKYEVNVHGRGMFDLVCGEEGSEEIFPEWEVSDRPLFAQMCANDPDEFYTASKKIQHRVDAIDLNLGCPQGIARKGQYGAFLMEDPDRIFALVNKLHLELDIPVTAKFRCFEDVEKTVEYAKMLERAGAQILTIHGRTREMKGQYTGLADWKQIKAVKEAVNVPVFANGNILYYEDVQRCIDQTGVDGVMSAEGNLYNPAIFLSPSAAPSTSLATPSTPHEHIPITYLADRYLRICQSLQTKTSTSAVKSHLFKLLRPALEKEENRDYRDRLGRGVPIDKVDGEEGREWLVLWRVFVKDFEGRLLEQAWESYRVSRGEPDLDPLLGTAFPPIEQAFPIDPQTYIRLVPHWLSQPQARPLKPTAASHPLMTTSTSEAISSLHPTPLVAPLGANTPITCTYMVPPSGRRTEVHKCPNMASNSCPHRSCITHCRIYGAEELKANGMTPSNEDLGDGYSAGEHVGLGCEFHEEKVRAKAILAKEKKAEKERRRLANGGNGKKVKGAGKKGRQEGVVNENGKRELEAVGVAEGGLESKKPNVSDVDC